MARINVCTRGESASIYFRIKEPTLVAYDLVRALR